MVLHNYKECCYKHSYTCTLHKYSGREDTWRKNCQITGYAPKCLHQRRLRVATIPHAHKFWNYQAFQDRLFCRCVVPVPVTLSCISLSVNATKYLFIGLLAMRITSLVKCLFCLLGCFFFLLIFAVLYSRNKLFALPFYSLNRVWIHRSP